MAEDYYKTLGVIKSASGDEIKKSYRKLALRYHPDRNKTKEGELKFKEVTKAYEILSDNQKRQTYDQYGAAAFEQDGGAGPFGGQQGPFSSSYSTGNTGQGFDPSGFSDPFDIFEQFFGGGSRQRRQSYSLTIDFMEAVKGVEKKVDIDGKNQSIKIPAGVDDGNRIRFNDFDIIVNIRADSRFQREGADIVSEMQVTFAKACLGDILQVVTVNGEVKLKMPAGTQPETVFRLREKGMPKLRGNSHGDHYVRIKVLVPKHLTKKQKDLLDALDQEVAKKTWF
ncbi:integrase [Candidatus Levyibacteriota bacterium]|nr:molecular chaperone DnaJ [Candidatus Levybacteria bacterium]GDX62322.1 integrase [Candidatus Levybacteria bacterium]